jgi:hypothetical protein
MKSATSEGSLNAFGLYSPKLDLIDVEKLSKKIRTVKSALKIT